MKKTHSKKLEDLNQIIEIQGSHGNWNYDPYMFGMFNGLELARSIITDQEPEFREAPKKWLYKRTLWQNMKLWWLTKTGRAIQYQGINT